MQVGIILIFVQTNLFSSFGGEDGRRPDEEVFCNHSLFHSLVQDFSKFIVPGKF